MTRPVTLALVAALIALTGCAPAQLKPSPTPIPSATSSAPKWTSGDLAACKGYARVEADASKRLTDMGKVQLTALAVAGMLETMAKDLVSATGTASDSVMKQSLVATGAGLRQGAATARANKPGGIDLRPDLQVVADESDKVARICKQVDPSGTYRFIGNVS